MSTYLSTKDIAAKIRQQLRVELPQWKFSVSMKSFSMGSSITIALMQGPEQVIVAFRHQHLGEVKVEASYPGHPAAGYAQLNRYQLIETPYEFLNNGYYLTPTAWNVMCKAKQIVQPYHWSESDIQADYHACNFYYHLHIGKWNKDYEVTK